MTPKLSQQQIREFQKEILDWYAENKREFPWRVPSGTRFQQIDPYHILVSEVMSQQTQITRVAPKYEAWLNAFLTVNDLAKASTRDVLAHWSGLGYNRRALYLQKCAKEIVEKHNGKFPQEENELLQLPGIGKYTARAILCFAFNKQVAVVDTNVKKVILAKVQNSKVKSQNLTEKDIEEIAESLLPEGRARDWNQALMDYASAMLKNHRISVAKQSKFKGSDRYFRGKIIKFLLEKHQVSKKALFQLLQEKDLPFSSERFTTIVDGLEKDSFIIQSKQNVMLV